MKKSELPKELKDILERIAASMDDESKFFAIHTVVLKVLEPEPYNMHMTFLAANYDSVRDMQLEEEGITCKVILSPGKPIKESLVLIPYKWIYWVLENSGGVFNGDKDTIWYDEKVTEQVDFKKLASGEIEL